MFKNFTVEETVSSRSQVKSSVARGIRTNILELYPRLEPVIDQIMPKKESVIVGKCKDSVSVLITEQAGACFFQHKGDDWFPTLKLLHQYPSMMPKMQVDKGGLKFVLNGANVMAPGLTSPGGAMEEVESGKPVQIVGEGKEHAMAIGITTMSTAEINEKNKGFAITNLHVLNDGLWRTREKDWK